MPKIHSYLPFFMAAFILLWGSFSMVLYYNAQSDRTKKLAFESMRVVTEWNRLQIKTNQILLARVTGNEETSRDIIQSWYVEYRHFSDSLDHLVENPQVQKLAAMSEKLEGSRRVWRYTEVHLNNARYYFNLMDQSGLLHRVMVNGFLHTMYKLRMTGQLTDSEIYLLDDTIYALEVLDKSAGEFNSLLEEVVAELNLEGERYLQRVRVVLITLFCSIALLFVAVILINRQLKNAEKNRRVYGEEKKNRTLKQLCSDSSDSSVRQMIDFQKETGLIRLQTGKPILLAFIRFNTPPVSVMQHGMQPGVQLMSDALRETSGFEPDIFHWNDQIVIMLVNVSDPDLHDKYRSDLIDEFNRYRAQSPVPFNFVLGNITEQISELDEDFRILLRLGDYRYLTGPGTFIHAGSYYIHPGGEFHYPLEKERFLIEALNGRDEKRSLLMLDEILNQSKLYGPQAAKRTILRISSALTSTMEVLEKNRHLHFFDDFTPLIIEVQTCAFLEEARVIMSDMIVRLIEACRSQKEERHDKVITEIKNMVENDLEDFNLSSDSLASHLNLTASYINRLFKTHTSLSIASYINQQRLMRAEQLLRQGDNSITEIAAQAGFASSGTFFRLFRKHYGRTPGDFQREVLSGSIS